MYELAGAAMGCRRGVGVGMMGGGQQETVDRRLQVTAAAWPWRVSSPAPLRGVGSIKSGPYATLFSVCRLSVVCLG